MKKLNKHEQTILDFINEMGYDWTLDRIKEEYLKHKEGWYISYTAKKVIEYCRTSFEHLKIKT